MRGVKFLSFMSLTLSAIASSSYRRQGGVVVRAMSSSSTSKSSSSKRKPPLRGIVWDMDGTLTVPNLDFTEMYKRCGVDKNDDILTAIQKYSDDRRQECEQIIHQMEQEACETMQLLPYCQQTLQILHRNPQVCKSAIVTRNTHASVECLLHLLRDDHAFDLIIARDSIPHHPPKPHPSAMKYICNEWNIDLPSSSVVMVGDSLENDVSFGDAAGTFTVLLDPAGKYTKKLTSSTTTIKRPDITISCLSQLPDQLAEHFELPS
jgi:HAD superfamily hydrolase (TIGR01549 family)